MGFFDWFLGAKADVNTDERIWLTRQAKLLAVAREIDQALADPSGPRDILVVAHFQDVLEDLRALVDRAGFDKSRVKTALAGDLKSPGLTSGGVANPRGTRVIMAERHPLSSHEQVLLDFARSLSCSCRVSYHLSLEDPVLRVIAGQWISDVLKRLGMEPDQAVESQMVLRRVRAAHQALEKRAVGDTPASSAQEWLEKNCPGLVN